MVVILAISFQPCASHCTDMLRKTTMRQISLDNKNRLQCRVLIFKIFSNLVGCVLLISGIMALL